MDIVQLKWNKPFESQTSKRALRLNRLWNNSNTLYCDLKNAAKQGSYQIQNTESTWFSSNKPLLLGSIFLTTLTNHSGFNDLQFEIHIIEYDTCTFDTNASNNVLFTKKIYLGNGFIQTVLPHSLIIIKPRKAYEIRLQHKSTNLPLLCVEIRS